MTSGQVLVAGGGLAGAAAAAGLARAGIGVTLIERHAAPRDKICGEFLSTEAQAYLTKLGLPLGGLGGAPISRLRLVRGGRVVEAELPFAGLGLSRRRLDEALLQHAQRSGARLLRGRTIRHIGAGPEPTLEVEGEGTMTAPTLLLATGKHELRGASRGEAARLAPQGPRDVIAFKMNFRLSAAAQAALTSCIELIFFKGGYAGLQMIEDGLANLCLLVRRRRFIECGGWAGLLEYLQSQSSWLAARLAGAAPQWAQPLSIYRVPYGFIHRPQPAEPERLFRIGDQACVIQPFTGDGMSLALHSATLAVRMITGGGTAPAYHRLLASQVRGQIRRADLLDRLLNHSLTQPAILGLARLWPRTLALAAELTRVPRHARL